MEEIFLIIDSTLNLSKNFPEVDKELILLAFNKKSNGSEERLRKKYAVRKMNYQALEYFGDSILDLITNSFLMDLYELSLEVKDYSKIRQIFVKNYTLTQLSIELGFYEKLFPDEDISQKHNLCADTFEALIGALWLQYRDEKIPYIRDWFFGIEIIRKKILEIIEEYIKDLDYAKLYKEENEFLEYENKEMDEMEEEKEDLILQNEDPPAKKKNKKENKTDDEILEEYSCKEEKKKKKIDNLSYFSPILAAKYLSYSHLSPVIEEIGDINRLSIENPIYKKLIELLSGVRGKKNIQSKIKKYGKSMKIDICVHFGMNKLFEKIYLNHNEQTGWWGTTIKTGNFSFFLYPFFPKEEDYNFYRDELYHDSSQLLTNNIYKIHYNRFARISCPDPEILEYREYLCIDGNEIFLSEGDPRRIKNIQLSHLAINFEEKYNTGDDKLFFDACIREFDKKGSIKFRCRSKEDKLSYIMVVNDEKIINNGYYIIQITKYLDREIYTRTSSIIFSNAIKILCRNGLVPFFEPMFMT